MGKKHLEISKKNKNDEFYTRLTDIEAELKYYKHFLKGKRVLCDCDDPRKSNFTRYFLTHFRELELAELVCSCYARAEDNLFDHSPNDAVMLKVDNPNDAENIINNGLENAPVVPLEGNGDFRTAEIAELRKQCDVIITNPPFSLFREYYVSVLNTGKDFLLIAFMHALSYKCVFPSFADGRMNLGATPRPLSGTFETPSGKIQCVNSYWLTSIPHGNMPPPLELTAEYCPEKYHKFVNYDAININKSCDIPKDYYGMMGVPFSFAQFLNRSQFEVLSHTARWSPLRLDTYTKSDFVDPRGYHLFQSGCFIDITGEPLPQNYYVLKNGRIIKQVFARMIIRRRQTEPVEKTPLKEELEVSTPPPTIPRNIPFCPLDSCINAIYLAVFVILIPLLQYS